MWVKKWTKIEDCPHNKPFYAVLVLGYRVKIKKVYVHMDNHWLEWKQLRTLKHKNLPGWKCIYYFDIK